MRLCVCFRFFTMSHRLFCFLRDIPVKYLLKEELAIICDVNGRALFVPRPLSPTP